MTDQGEHDYSNLPDLINDLEPHDHLCLIYESREEWLQTVVPFISSGLERGEKCIYFVDANTIQEIKGVFKEAGLAVDEYECKGQLRITHERDACKREGFFDPDRMIAFLIAETEQALREGYPALRITDEMSWTLRGNSDTNKILEYEAKLNKEFYSEYPCIGICQYDRWKFDPEIIKGLVLTHSLLIRGGQIYRNFYYVEPDEYLSQKKVELEVQQLFNNLERERNIEKSLRKSEEKYRYLAENIIDVIWTADLKGRLTYISPSIEKMIGFTPEELMATPAGEHIVREDYSAMIAKLTEELAKPSAERDRTATFEVRYKTKDNRIVFAELKATWIIDEQGNLAGIQGSSRDITERKKAEKALRESEEKYRQIFYHSPIGIYCANCDGVITDCNETFVKSMGSSYDAIVGLNTLKLPDQRIVQAIKGALQGDLTTFEGVYESTTAQKTTPLRALYAPIKSSDRKVIGLVAIVEDITERKKAEEKLKQEQLEKELILDNLAEQVAFIDTHMRIIWANSKVIERHNLYEDDYQGQICYELYHQLNEPCPDCPVVEALKTGKICSGVHKSPDNIYWQITGIPVHNQDGKITGVMNTSLDITDLITSSQELQESYSLLRLAGETAKFGGWSVDFSTNRVAWSDQVAMIHDMPVGFSPSLDEGISFYVPEWRDKIIAVFTACVEKDIPFDEEMEIVTAKGRRIWVRTTGEAIKDDKGAIVRVQGSFQDISEQKIIESSLRQSEERLDLAMSVKNEGIWDWNLITNETYFDDRYYTMAGYQPDEFPENFAAWAEHVHEEDLPQAQKSIKGYLNGESDKFDIEFRFKKKNGQWMWINGKGKIYERDASGKPVRMIGTHTDITDRKMAEKEIRILNAELEQRVMERTTRLEAVNKELESFAYSVSHDLRTPLRALDGFSASLKNSYADQLDEQGQHYLDRINNAVIYMSNLIDGLLKLSRITRTDLKQQKVDISHLALEITKELQEAEPESQVVVEIAPGLSARGDLTFMRALMENLLGNAWKFSSREAQAKIEVGMTEIDKEKVFFVRDNGVGFNMAYADEMFGAFQRLHGVDEFPGTGIGLATVQRIINRHGSRIWAESEVGRGSTFYFTLPV